VRLHPFAHALHSSMGFALNLFLHFRLGDPAPLAEVLSAKLGRVVEIERVVFEYGGPGDVLAEVSGAEPGPDEAFTASDVAVFARDRDGRRGVVLIEVKLSEDGFSTCGGAESRGNRRSDVCGSAERLFAEPGACYLRRPVRASRDRRYWPIFEREFGSLRTAFPGCTGGECPFRGPGQQIMRNHALLLGLQQAGIAEFGAFGLVHHDGNAAVVAQWSSYVEMCARPETMLRMPANRIVELLPAMARWMRARYALEVER
jgi:hypothetical protein